MVAVLAVGGIAYGVSGGGTSTQNQTVIFSRVTTRTLQNTVALTGTLARKSIRNINASTQGIISSVTASAGDTMHAGQSLFGINGRDAIAEDGSVPFFRALAPGDQGEDVLQLKRILAAAGDYPGPMNNYFSQQTQFALAQWQAKHHYPNSTPATQQSVNVSLQQGTGYTVGAQASAALLIGPPPAQAASYHPAGGGGSAGAGGTDATLVDQRIVDPTSTPGVVTIQSVDDQVNQGQAATFVVSDTVASTSLFGMTINLTSGGTAGSQDIVTPPTTVSLSYGETEATVSVQTRSNTLVEADPTIIMSVAAGSGYTIGTPSSAETTIANNNVPKLSIAGSSTVTPGGTATVTVTADQAPIQTTQIELELSGSAQPGTDYDNVNPVLTMDAGATSATFSITTIKTSVIQPDKYIDVSLAPSPADYSVTSQDSAVITIAESTGKPTVTLTSATTYLQKGQPYDVSIGLSEALSSSLTIQLSYGGSAVKGVDFTPPSGTITIPAGQTTLAVEIPTVTNNIVEANRTLTVSLAPNAAYLIGAPNSASVTIDSAVLPTLTITGNTTSIAQGGAASFTITASQAPVKNTSVNFAVQGTAQPGQDYVPLAGTALLLAGQTSVTVVFQSIQNNIEFEPTDMIIGSWPTRVGQVNVKVGNAVQPGEAILSLTEPNLSVTLMASAADRTELKVGQKCTVQISGENAEGSGVITELDANPTVTSGPAGSSSQVYEGKIEVNHLTGADGSAVSINVVYSQVINALTVPIAAVNQNGTGQDVVRVITLKKGGRIFDVPVKTGLTQGSYIQVKGGLHAGELVIAGVNHP